MRARTFGWFLLVMALLVLALLTAGGGGEGRVGRWLAAIHGPR